MHPPSPIKKDKPINPNTGFFPKEPVLSSAVADWKAFSYAESTKDLKAFLENYPGSIPGYAHEPDGTETLIIKLVRRLSNHNKAEIEPLIELVLSKGIDLDFVVQEQALSLLSHALLRQFNDGGTNIGEFILKKMKNPALAKGRALVELAYNVKANLKAIIGLLKLEGPIEYREMASADIFYYLLRSENRTLMDLYLEKMTHPIAQTEAFIACVKSKNWVLATQIIENSKLLADVIAWYARIENKSEKNEADRDALLKRLVHCEIEYSAIHAANQRYEAAVQALENANILQSIREQPLIPIFMDIRWALIKYQLADAMQYIKLAKFEKALIVTQNAFKDFFSIYETDKSFLEESINKSIMKEILDTLLRALEGKDLEAEKAILALENAVRILNPMIDVDSVLKSTVFIKLADRYAHDLGYEKAITLYNKAIGLIWKEDMNEASVNLYMKIAQKIATCQRLRGIQYCQINEPKMAIRTWTSALSNAKLCADESLVKMLSEDLNSLIPETQTTPTTTSTGSSSNKRKFTEELVKTIPAEKIKPSEKEEKEDSPTPKRQKRNHLFSEPKQSQPPLDIKEHSSKP